MSAGRIMSGVHKLHLWASERPIGTVMRQLLDGQSFDRPANPREGSPVTARIFQRTRISFAVSPDHSGRTRSGGTAKERVKELFGLICKEQL